ncbi:MAG TPA: head GIN domain-containing protein, partial [Flavitalea sp.]|nr:head GIN domain-containing protein [Flavitalea sp.]
MMKTIMICLVVLIGSVSLQAQRKIVDQNAEVRKVSSFHAIKVSNAIDVELTQSDEEALAVSASKDEYRARIRTEVDNGVLKIWYDDEGRWFRNSGNKKLKAYISFRSLDKLTAAGACDVNVTGFIRTSSLQLNFSGASDFRGAIQVNALDIELSGASDVRVSGSAATVKVDVSGASQLKAYDLSVDNCKAEASGASDIQITI